MCSQRLVERALSDSDVSQTSRVLYDHVLHYGLEACIAQYTDEVHCWLGLVSTQRGRRLVSTVKQLDLWIPRCSSYHHLRERLQALLNVPTSPLAMIYRSFNPVASDLGRVGGLRLQSLKLVQATLCGNWLRLLREACNTLCILKLWDITYGDTQAVENGLCLPRMAQLRRISFKNASLSHDGMQIEMAILRVSAVTQATVSGYEHNETVAMI